MKSKFKRMMFLLIGVSTMIVICIAVGFFGQNEDDVIMNRIVGVVAIISGIGSVIMGVSSIFTSSLDNVREYYATGDTEQMSAARKVLYNYRYIKIKYGKTVYDDDFDQWVKENIDASQAALRDTTKKEILDAASLTANFFQMWGLLQNKGFLPIWVFETASGYNIIKLYEAIDDIVLHNRAGNPFYAEQFQKLCVRINDKYKKAILECRKREKQYIAQALGVKDLSDNRYFNKLSNQ